jgi:pimeloyl-ACP methyl ester carboxylesterase
VTESDATSGLDPYLVPLSDGRLMQIWQGGAAGPAVFFFHGCPDSRLAALSGDAAAKRRGVHLVAANRPGYGRSDPHQSGHASFADDTVAVADALGIDQFAVIGMSLGGPYALACAARHPDRVTRAALIASPAVVPELDPPCHRDQLAAQVRREIVEYAALSVTEVIARMRPGFEEYIARVAPNDVDDDALVQRSSAGLHPRDVELLASLPSAQVASAAREALATPEGYLRDAAATFRRWEVRPEDVRCPTRLWYGELDPNVSVRNGHWLSRHITDSTLTVRPDTAHLGGLVDHWDEVLEAVS